MTPKARKIVVAMLVVLVPLMIANLATVTTFVMNATVLPVGFERHPDIPYGDDGSLRLDVYVPTSSERAAVVVLWHGGMWRQGSKDDVRFVGAALARSGFVAVVPNYRLYPSARYRDFLDDGAIAVSWTRRNAAQFGADADDLFLMGHSAGAYIASMLAFDERLLASRGISTSCIDGIISLSGPHTFERPAAFLDEIFGKPRDAGWRPMDVASEHAPSTLLLHGYDDYVVWGSEPIAMAKRLHSLNVPVELRLYEGRSHQDMLTAWSRLLQFRAPVRKDVVAFVNSTVTHSTRGAACNSRRPRPQSAPQGTSLGE